MGETVIILLVRLKVLPSFRCINGLSSLQLQTVSSHPLPDATDLVDDGLEVGSRIVRTGDENIIGLTRGCRRVQRRDRNEPGRFDTGQLYGCLLAPISLTCQRSVQAVQDRA